MATTISARNSSIELLRIFTMASVLMGHSFGHGAHGEVSYDGLFCCGEYASMSSCLSRAITASI